MPPIRLPLRPRAPAGGRPARLPSQRGPRPARASLSLLVILAAQLMVVLDTTIVNVALPHIQADLGFSGSALSWVLNAYILTFGGLLLLGARAGDLHGRRRVFLAGIAVFSLSSLAGGFATAGWMLLATRALQGIGGALAAPSALALLAAVFPEGPQRLRAIALYATVSAAGGATGLVAGGLLTQLVSWRWVMFVNVPIGVAAWLVGRRVLVETPRRPGRFDLLGAVTATLGMGSLVFGLVEAGSDGWTSQVTLAALALGVALLAVFVRTEARAAEPILPLHLLAHPTRTAANLARGLVYAGMYGTFFFLSQFFQDVQGLSALVAGVAFLPMPTTVFLSSQLTSRVLVRRIPEKLVMLIGIGTATLGIAAATRLHSTAPYPEVLATLLMLGAGLGMAFVALTSASLAEVEPRDAGAASGLINVSQQIGGAIGLAVLVSVFSLTTGHLQLGAGATAAGLARVHGTLAGGLDVVFGVGAGFALAALILVAVMVRMPWRRTARAERADAWVEDAPVEVAA
jgi:EmrB/QacA subfamily drug resistance transporter